MKDKHLLGVLRIFMGFIFLCSFLDKLFGLGFSTPIDKAWILGNSPTMGFLQFASKGPLASFFQELAGNPIVDWLFMSGLLFAGLALIFGVIIKISSFIGSIMMLLIWLSRLPPENNPLIDEHIIYILVLIILAAADSGDFLGLGKYWKKIPLVKKYSILR
jgi:thiosulfate dehydrogenase [quinone] large subunit